jgi:hypothetical protein
MARHAPGEKSRLLMTVVDRCPLDRSWPVLPLRDRILADGGTGYCGAHDRRNTKLVLVEAR